MWLNLSLAVIISLEYIIKSGGPLPFIFHVVFFDLVVLIPLVDPSSSFDDGLRRRNVPAYGAQRPRTSDEDDEDEEMEFMLAEKKEEKPWLSLNKCIVGSLILLFLASLFLSGEFLQYLTTPASMLLLVMVWCIKGTTKTML